MSLISKATGNFTAAGTWNQVNAGASAELDSEATTTAIGTSNIDSSSFVLTANQVDAVAIKISARAASPSGTLSVTLRNVTGGTNIGTCTVNISDLQVNARGWHVFPIGVNHTPNGTDTYSVRLVCSQAGSQITTYCSVANNHSRAIRRTSTAAPASGDKLIIAGEFTGAGTGNSFVITLDNTATTSFGPTVSGGPPQGVTINDKASLQLGSAGSTNYYLKWKGILGVFAGGKLLLDVASATTGSVTAASNKGLTGRVTNSTNATPISVESFSHGLSTGDIITMVGNIGNTAANGTFEVTVTDANNFTIKDSAGSSIAGNGVHAYAGTPTGLWFCPIAVTSTAHGLSTGDQVTVVDVVGNTGANGAFIVTAFGANKFLLDGSMGIAAYTSGGTWVKRTGLDSTSTCVMEMDSAANVDTGIEIYADGIFSAVGATKTVKTTMKQSTVIGSDTNSVGSLVDTSGTTCTWKEGAKFDTNWTGTFTVNGSSFTISSVTATSITATGSIGTNTGATFAFTGTVGAGVNPAVIKVEDTTGWLATDIIALASSSRRYQDNEQLTISTVDSSTQVTATAKPTAYHSGLNDANGDVRAEVINLTRNVKIRGISVTLQGYIYQATAQSKLCCKYVEFYNLGSGTTNKRGVTTFNGTLVGGFNLQYCAFHDFTVASSNGVCTQHSSGHNCPIVNQCVWYGATTNTFFNFGGGTVATTGSWTITNTVALASSGSNNLGLIDFADVGGVFTGNVVCGWLSNLYAVAVRETNFIGPFNNNKFHSNSVCPIGNNGTASVMFKGIFGDTTANQVMWRTAGINTLYGTADMIVDGLKVFGCGASAAGGDGQILITPSCFYRNTTLDAGANLVSVTGFYSPVQGGPFNAFIENCLIGQTTPHSVSDVGIGTNSSNVSLVQVIFNNCKFANATWLTVGSAPAPYYLPGSYVVSLNHNQTNAWQAYVEPTNTRSLAPALIQSDSSVYRTATPSLKMTPNSAFLNTTLRKLQSPTINVPVVSGTTISPAIYVRQSKASTGDSADYNGLQPRLILLANQAIGINYDIVLATGVAAIGNWELLTGTSATFSANGVARIIVDCDGTTGFVNVDDFSCGGVPSTNGFAYWGQDFIGPAVYGEPPVVNAQQSLFLQNIGTY